MDDVTPAPQQPLSGDVQGMASNQPEANVGQAPVKAAPASKVDKTAAPPPKPENAPEDPSRSPASAPAPAPQNDDPFAQELANRQTQQDAQTPSDDPFAAELNARTQNAAQAVPPGKSEMQGFVSANLQAHAAQGTNAPPTTIAPEDPIHDFVHSLEAGLQISTSGLAIRGKMPDTVLPEHADLAMRIGNQIGTLAGDLPAMAAGFVGGGVAGSEVPVVGNAIGAAAGSFALPAAIRKMYIDHYTRGDIADAANPAREFVSRLMGTAWEGIKGGTTGAAASLTGGIVSPVAGKVVGAAAEIAAMTTVGAALEGHLPQPHEFLDAGILMGGLHGLTHVMGAPGGADKLTDPAEKVKNVFAATGETPMQQVQAMEDVGVKQDYIAGNAKEPVQASPANLEHSVVKEPGAEGAPDKVTGTKTELVPKTAEDMGFGEQPEKVGPESQLDKEAQLSEDKQYLDSKIGMNGEAPTKSWGQSFKEWYANAVDYLAPINNAEKLAKERGADINPETSAENLMRQNRAFGDRAALIISRGVEDPVTGKVKGEGLDQIFKDMHDAGLNTDDYRRFAMAADAVGDQEHNSGLDLERAQRVKDALAPSYQEFHDRINAFRGNLLDWAAGKGLITEDAAAEAKSYTDYSPRKRAFEADLFGEEKGQGKAGLQAREGSDRDYLDPVMQTKIDTERLVRKVLLNEARGQFVTNMEAGNLIDTDGKWAETALPPVLKKIGTFGGILKGDTAPEGEIQRRPLGDNQIEVYRDGKREVYEGSELTIDSLKRLDGNPAALDLTSKILRGFTNAVRIGVVSNPAFGLAHFLRGQIMAGINSDTGLLPLQALGALGDVVGKSDQFQDFLAKGGGAGRFLDADHGYLATDLAKEDNAKAPWYGKAWNSALNPLHWSEGFIRLTDTATKFSEYQRSLKQGAGPGEAMENSRMVTPDYSNVGLQQSILRTGVAFIGAHINSLDNMARVAQRDPMGVAMRMSVMMGMSAGLWYLNKDDEAIDAVPDWQKNTYWNINLSRFSPDYKGPQDATILRIPKPWAPGILFGSGTEQVLDAYFKPRPSELPHFAQSLMKSVVPDVVPNMVQPVLDQYSNKQAFTGRPLVPAYKEHLLPEMQYQPYTGETAKAIGKLIGYVPLVRDIGPSSDTLASPAVVENYIKGWGGTMGSWALQAADKAISSAKGDTLDKATPWQDDPVVHSFISRYPSFQDQRIQDFYDNKNAADAAMNTYKAAAKSGDTDAADAILKSHPEMMLHLNVIGDAMSKARRTYEQVQQNPDMPAVEKRQLMDTMLFQMGSMAKMGNQMMEDFKKNTAANVAGGR